MTPEQAQALDVARALAAAGVPVFIAKPAPRAKIGFQLPPRWQQTRPDPAVVDAWEPGDAIAVVCGRGLDLIDVDPRNGADASSLNGSTPTSYAAALTPSGGVHSFIASLGVRSRDNVLPGIDIKAGHAGAGHGFAFIAPTVRPSKVTGEPQAYRWATVPDLARLAALLRHDISDDSGARLRAMIDEARTPSAPAQTYTGPAFDDMPLEQQQIITDWVTREVEEIRAGLVASASWAPGQTDDRGRGWEKLQADAALWLGQLARATWNDFDLAEAEAIFLEAAPVDGSWSSENAGEKWRQQSHRREPAGFPASLSDAFAWARMGLDPKASSSGPAPVDQPQPPHAAAAEWRPLSPEEIATRYFGPGGIQAVTLAADTIGFGPLRTGVDDILWSYADGVWRPDKHAVRDRTAKLLGQRFRTSFVGTIEAVVRAASETITSDPLPDIVNFRNGLLHWRTGELLPHSPDVPTTVQLPVEYDPAADCPAFEAFIAQVVPEDVVPTVWELIGYLMYSGNPLHKAVMLTGTGRNGKGTFIRVLQALLGTRNVTNVSLHDLVNTRFTTASLFGKLANIAGDIDATYMENTATFKGITGGDTISAEHKGRDRFDFTPWAVPLFSANKIPASADTTEGYLSRWLVIPFPNNFTGREDRHLDERLHRPEELRGIAARGIAALPGLLARGDFARTISGDLAREEFVRRVDQVRTWISDCCSIDPGHPWVARTDLYEAYKRWALRDGHRPVRATEFYERLEQAGAEPAKVHGARGFNRILVIDDGYATTSGRLPTAPSGPAPSMPDAAPSTPAPVPSPLPAPTAQDHKTAGQPQRIHNEGAQGAQTSHPPIARVRAGEGVEAPAPCAPNAPTEAPQLELDGVNPEPKPKSPRGSAAASQKAAEKREAKRLAAIAEASGATIPTPAVVTRDGAVRPATLNQADQLLGTLAGQELTVDVENTGYPVGHVNYALRTVQLGDEHWAVVLDPHDPDQADVVRRAMTGAAVLHAHSATADLVPLAEGGHLDFEEALARMIDTAVLAKLADPESTDNSADLKGLAKAVLGDQATSPAADAARAALFKAGRWLTETEVTTPIERSGWAQVDSTSETMTRYAASDVLDCAALARRLPALDERSLQRERLAQTMTARIALRGIPIDGDQVGRLLPEHEGLKARFGERIQAYGIENPGSPMQVGVRFRELGAHLPETPTGKPSVKEAALEALAGDRDREPLSEIEDLARTMLDWREHDTALKLFLRPYHELVTRGDGRARPTVYTLGAKTGRMSCVRPNLQQLPREGGFRACITADPGHVLVSVDFSQVELRVAAALSEDRDLQAILAEADADPNGQNDLHWRVAKIAFGPNATKSHRYRAKRKVFGRLYGQGLNGMANTDGAGPAVARAIIDALDAITPRLSAWSNDIKGAVEAGRTQFPAYSGRTIHLPKRNPYAAGNYAIQGTARELLIDALERWAQTPWGHCTLWPVHDEVVASVPEAEATEATAALASCMTSELYGVPIVAEASEPSFYWKDSS